MMPYEALEKMLYLKLFACILRRTPRSGYLRLDAHAVACSGRARGAVQERQIDRQAETERHTQTK